MFKFHGSICSTCPDQLNHSSSPPSTAWITNPVGLLLVYSSHVLWHDDVKESPTRPGVHLLRLSIWPRVLTQQFSRSGRKSWGSRLQLFPYVMRWMSCINPVHVLRTSGHWLTNKSSENTWLGTYNTVRAILAHKLFWIRSTNPTDLTTLHDHLVHQPTLERHSPYIYSCPVRRKIHVL